MHRGRLLHLPGLQGGQVSCLGICSQGVALHPAGEEGQVTASYSLRCVRQASACNERLLRCTGRGFRMGRPREPTALEGSNGSQTQLQTQGGALDEDDNIVDYLW